LALADGNSVIAGEEGFGFAIERVAAFLQLGASGKPGAVLNPLPQEKGDPP
jgi:hypothetical protein